MRSFGKIPARISDPRSLGPWSIEGTDESFPRVDLSIPLMCCDPSDLGSLVLTRIIPMERTFSSSSIGKSWGAFLWYDPDQNQWSEIIWIMVDQMNRWILVQSGFIGSFDLPWSEWSLITDTDPDHPKGAHPGRKLHTKIQKASSETQGQIVGARESVNGQEKNGAKKSTSLHCPSPPLSAHGFPRMYKMKIFW